MTRRALVAGAALALVLPAAATGAPMTTRLAPYVQPLPLPAKAQPVSPSTPNTYRMTMRATTLRMHPKLPETRVYGYDDGTGVVRSPGPAIVAREDVPTQVTWVNALPATHILLPAIDTMLTMGQGTSVRTLEHLHGGLVRGTSDGNPYATPVPEPATITDTYSDNVEPSLLWYHDHALGLTRLNPYAGLAGPYVIRDELDTGAEPNPIGLPGGKYELPLVIQDKQFDRAGQLVYPPAPWVPEFFGNETVVNGAVEPYVNVEPRRYRLRTLNGSNARFYNIEIVDPAGTPLTLRQHAAEQGFFDAPVAVRQSLILPGERADLVVDFAKYAGRTLVMRNAPLPKGIVSPAPRLPSVMKIRVGTKVTDPDPGPVPATLPGENTPLPAPVLQRDLTLEEQLDPSGNPVRLLIDGKRFEDPVSETPVAGTVEDWRFVNVSADTHPMHMHLVRFQVMGRQRFDAARYAADLARSRAARASKPDVSQYELGAEVGPRPNERGWKDTVAANPGELTRIRIRWTPPSDAEYPERYVFHCHILEHEENDMMRPIDLEAPAAR